MLGIIAFIPAQNCSSTWCYNHPLPSGLIFSWYFMRTLNAACSSGWVHLFPLSCKHAITPSKVRSYILNDSIRFKNIFWLWRKWQCFFYWNPATSSRRRVLYSMSQSDWNCAGLQSFSCPHCFTAWLICANLNSISIGGFVNFNQTILSLSAVMFSL